MKKLFIWIPSLLLAFGSFSSCSDDESGSLKENGKMKLSFRVNLSDIVNREVDYNELIDNTNETCEDYDVSDMSWFDEGNYAAKIKISLLGGISTFEDYVELTKDAEGNIVTKPIMLVKPATGVNHTLESFVIVKQEGTDETVIFSAVHENSTKYNSHVISEHLMPMDLSFEEETGNLSSYTKSTIDISLLCAVNIPSDDFGFAIWGLNFTKVYCLDYTVNVPSDPCAEMSSDVVGTTQVTLIKQTLVDGEWKDTLTHVGTTSESGVKGNICFNDQGTIEDENERYLFTMKIIFPSGDAFVSGTLTLAQMMDYECSGYWETPVGGTNGILHFNFADVDFSQIGAITPTGNVTGCEAPWELSVTTPIHCGDACENVCTDPEFLSDFTTFTIPTTGTEACDWNVTNGVRAGTDIILTSGVIKTPLVNLSAKDTVYIKYGTGTFSGILDQVTESGINPLEAPIEGIQQLENNCSRGYILVPEDGCYRLQINGGPCVDCTTTNAYIYLLEYKPYVPISVSAIFKK